MIPVNQYQFLPDSIFQVKKRDQKSTKWIPSCHYPHNNHNGSSEFSDLTLTIWNENGFARSIHFRIQCIQMLAKQSLESQAYQILMWHASALFSNFLWVKLRRQRRPMSPFHLYNNRVQRQNPLPNYQFHQIQDKFKKLGRVLFAQVRKALGSACWHFGISISSIQIKRRYPNTTTISQGICWWKGDTMMKSNTNTTFCVSQGKTVCLFFLSQIRSEGYTWLSCIPGWS